MAHAIRAVRRYFNWRGRQRPMLGIGLGATNPLEVAAEPERVRRSWSRVVALAEELGLDAVLLPTGIWRDADATCELLKTTAEAGKACLLPLDSTCLTLDDIELERRMRRFSSAHRGLLATLPLDRGDDADRIEDRLAPVLSGLSIPLLVTRDDPLGPHGRALRCLSRTVDAIGASLGPLDPCDPASVLATSLAVRIADRPSVLIAEPERLESFTAIARAAMLAGTALSVLRLPTDHDDEEIRAALTPLTAVLDELPDEISDPRDERVRILVLDDKPGPKQPTDAIIAALLLLHRAARVMASLCFEAVADPSDQQRLIWVPVHGSLEPGAWRRCWSLAHSGSLVVLTGLCVETEADREFLGKLAIPVTVNQDLPDQPAWLRNRACLDTGGRLLSRPVGDGILAVYEGAIELTPDSDAADTLVHQLLATAELAPELPLHSLDHSGPRRFSRELHFAQGKLSAELLSGAIKWTNSS